MTLLMQSLPQTAQLPKEPWDTHPLKRREEEKQEARHLEGLVQGSDRKEVISSVRIRQTFKA